MANRGHTSSTESHNIPSDCFQRRARWSLSHLYKASHILFSSSFSFSFPQVATSCSRAPCLARPARPTDLASLPHCQVLFVKQAYIPRTLSEVRVWRARSVLHPSFPCHSSPDHGRRPQVDRTTEFNFFSFLSSRRTSCNDGHYPVKVRICPTAYDRLREGVGGTWGLNLQRASRCGRERCGWG